MLANNGGANQVWKYSGSAADWTPITGTNTSLTSITGDSDPKGGVGNLFLIGSNNGPNLVWQYDGSGTNWSALTGANTSIALLAEASGVPYTVGTNGGPDQLWRYGGSGTSWATLTGTNTSVSRVVGGFTCSPPTGGGLRSGSIPDRARIGPPSQGRTPAWPGSRLVASTCMLRQTTGGRISSGDTAVRGRTGLPSLDRTRTSTRLRKRTAAAIELRRLFHYRRRSRPSPLSRGGRAGAVPPA